MTLRELIREISDSDDIEIKHHNPTPFEDDKVLYHGSCDKTPEKIIKKYQLCTNGNNIYNEDDYILIYVEKIENKDKCDSKNDKVIDLLGEIIELLEDE